MTHHNITGSDVGQRRPLVYLASIKRRRRGAFIVEQLKAVHPAVWLHLAMVPLGIGAGLVDVFVIGKPYSVVFALLGLLGWGFWPSRR